MSTPKRKSLRNESSLLTISGVDGDIYTDDYDDDDDDDGPTASCDTASEGDNHKKVDYLQNNTEKHVISCSKCFMISFLLLSATVVAVSIYRLIANEEEDEFLSTFDAASDETLEVANKLAQNIFGVVEGFSMLITSSAVLSGSHWPFVTIPDFETHSEHVRKLTNSLVIAFAPLVSQDDKEEWELYAYKHQGWWISDPTQTQTQNNHDEEPTTTSYYYNHSQKTITSTYYEIPRSIYNHEDYHKQTTTTTTTTDEGPFLPLWQFSPPPNTEDDFELMKFDLLSLPIVKKLVHYSIETRTPILSEKLEQNMLHGLEHHDDDKEEEQPESILVQPVFENLHDEHAAVVGHVIAVIPWHVYLEDILEGEAVAGIHVIVSDSCGNSFTYQIDGAHPIYLGGGDQHEHDYTFMGKGGSFGSFSSTASTSSSDEDSEEADDTSTDAAASSDDDDNDDDPSFLESRDEFSTKNSDDDDDDDDDDDSSSSSRHDDDGNDICHFRIYIYPTDEMHQFYLTNKPTLYTLMVVIIFSFTSIIFMGYDFIVQRRQKRVWHSAVRSNAIISSLFPDTVRDQLLNSRRPTPEKWTETRKQRLKTFLTTPNSGGNSEVDPDSTHPSISGGAGAMGSKPIADFFPTSTILFADVANFTAWSSIREPSQVFTLLETVYGAFDEVARRQGVFKIETIGDCYVAVVGVPDPRDDHALVMARFARICLDQFHQWTRKLIVTLGPGTGELGLRVGLHSGPVTAGVLRGERARFQLFGDTVNTTARMESTGKKNKIHISSSTAQLIIEAGKANWVEKRNETVIAKGKGELTTYWLKTRENYNNERATNNKNENGSAEGSSDSDPWTHRLPSEREGGILAYSVQSDLMQRLAHWHCEVLGSYLKQIIAKRKLEKLHRKKGFKKAMSFDDMMKAEETITHAKKTVLPVEEVSDVITLPTYDAKLQQRRSLLSSSGSNNNTEDVPTLDPEVEKQLHSFVSTIASLYRQNPFHNFEHASHVTMSTVKLLSRIVAPDTTMEDIMGREKTSPTEDIGSELHDHTYGVTSDPLTQFAVVFSAIIHDVDHRGVPNFILNKEEEELAAIYKMQSVAEQNSIDIAWNALMDPSLSALRKCIYTDENELKRFRQLVVNSVIATDIFDKELAANRKMRWNKAFYGAGGGNSHDNATLSEQKQEDVNRKATIVIEHLIQASDVVHTMQHWHVYRKWNERLFAEMYKAYRTGRSSTDPSVGWYSGELGFFDNYVIPLAKKLKSCGVFGVSSDEYLNYAEENRREWSLKGEELVKTMLLKYNELYQDNLPKIPE